MKELSEIIGEGTLAMAAQVVLEEVENGCVSADTLINAQNEGIDVAALAEIADDVYQYLLEASEELEDAEAY